MIDAGELRKGIAILLEGKIYQVVEYTHIKMGRGSAQVKLRLRDVRGGGVIERAFQATERFEPAFLEHRPVQFLYADGSTYNVMDTETYEQFELDADQIGEGVKYLKDGLMLEVLMHDGSVVSVELPIAVELAVVETDPGFKGNTATGGNKPAKLETGATVNVPLFISVGDILKIDTRSGSYIEKAS
ncbi:MAG: elongation factor P [Dehalococcoidia bacterium]|jgi:elongation factor P|nr:elongation factor P [Dehalococcoidia bacterium]